MLSTLAFEPVPSPHRDLLSSPLVTYTNTYTSNYNAGLNTTRCSDNANKSTSSSSSTRAIHGTSADVNTHRSLTGHFDTPYESYPPHVYNTLQSGRSSPEYKDNEPGSMHAPTYHAPNTHSGVAGNNGSGNGSGSGSDLHNTPYNKGYTLEAANDSSTNTTPYYNSTSAYNYITTSTTDTPYRTTSDTALNESFDSTYSSPPKVALQFEPESDDFVPFNSQDTSFDCEMVFTSIYGSNSAYPTDTTSHNTTCDTTDLSAAAHTTTKTAIYSEESDHESFQGENMHFKDNYLEQKSADSAWAGTKRAYASNRDTMRVSDTSGAGSPCYDPANGTREGLGMNCSSSYTNGAGGSTGTTVKGTWMPQFELSAEDAMKLGEVS